MSRERYLIWQSQPKYRTKNDINSSPVFQILLISYLRNLILKPHWLMDIFLIINAAFRGKTNHYSINLL